MAGFAVANRVKASDRSALEAFLKAFSSRPRLIEGMKGFRGLTVMVDWSRLEAWVVTFWESKEAFKAWVSSREFREAHERARAARLEGLDSEGFEFEVAEFKFSC